MGGGLVHSVLGEAQTEKINSAIDFIICDTIRFLKSKAKLTMFLFWPVVGS